MCIYLDVVRLTCFCVFGRRQAEQLERELAEVNRELASLRVASASMDALEERYWWVKLG